MKHPFILSPGLYAKVLDRLNSLHFTETPGHPEDMSFYQDDQWLYDTAVIENVILRRGTWEINLLFAHHEIPLKFLSRRITSNTCPKKANQMAFYMRRMAAKDQRGTLTVHIDRFRLQFN